MSKYDEMSFEQLLERGSAEVPKVRSLPSGTWLLKLRSKPTPKGKNKPDGKDSVMFVLQAMEATDNVDEQELQALGPDYDIKANRIFHRVWLGDGSDWDQLRNVLIAFGASSDFESFTEAFEEATGGEVYADLKTRYWKDDSGADREENVASNFQPVA